MSQCYFCRESERLEKHHIVPRRFDGSDDDENLVTVCPTCHSKLENLYDKRFYDRLGVDTGQSSKRRPCEYCGSPSDGQVVRFYAGQGIFSKFCCNDCSEERGIEINFGARE